jgi:hypothetical protein
MTDDRRIPLVPLLLGLAGLIPFAALSLVAALDYAPIPGPPRAALPALILYGATIVSFLGGIRWGQAVMDPDQRRARVHYAVSVLPQLAAWGTVLAYLLGALGETGCLAALSAVALATGLADYAFAKVGGAPLWFGRLRLGLSLGAAAALALPAL